MLRRLRRASHFRGRAEGGRQELARDGASGLGDRGAGIGGSTNLGDKGGLGDRAGAKNAGAGWETDSVDSMAQAIGLMVRETLEVAEKLARFRDLAKTEMFGALARAGQRVAPVAADFGAAVVGAGDANSPIFPRLSIMNSHSLARSRRSGRSVSGPVEKEIKMFCSFRKLGTLLDNRLDVIALTMGILTLTGVMAQVALGASARQKIFPSSEEAVRALIEASKGKDTKAIFEILGPEAKAFLETGDPISDRESRERFVKFYEESNALVKSGETKMILEIGKDKWPFPIPIVKESSGWRFDAKEGREEIIDRRIGRNELDVIQVCLAFVDAQLEYYRRNPLQEPLLQYAQKFLSTKGKRDGLYYETKQNEDASPWGSL